jgi:integrase
MPDETLFPEPNTQHPTPDTQLILPRVVSTDAEVQTSALERKDAFERNPALYYLNSLGSARSRQTMLGHLRNIARLMGYDFSREQDKHEFLLHVPWQTITYEKVVTLLRKERERGSYTNSEQHLAPSTLNCLRACLRGVAKAAYQLKLMTGDDYQRVGLVKQVRGKRLPPGRALSELEQLQLFETCRRDDSALGRRDAALFALGFGVGLRRAEIVSVTLADYTQSDGALKVIGKGNKQRKCHLDSASQLALLEWLRVRGSAEGPLLCRIRKASKKHPDGEIILNPPLTDKAVWHVLKRRAIEAGVLNVSPHDMRRTYISEMLAKGVGIEMVQQLVGHESPATTARYDRRLESERKAAAQKRGLPFRAKL